MVTETKFLFGLDVGSRRIGVARAHETVRIAQPYTTIQNTTEGLDELARLVRENNATMLVVGLPRGLNGQETAQTGMSRDFAASLAYLKVPIVLQDEAVTSLKAKEQLKKQGKIYTKDDVDALAAAYILEDYLIEQNERKA